MAAREWLLVTWYGYHPELFSCLSIRSVDCLWNPQRSGPASGFGYRQFTTVILQHHPGPAVLVRAQMTGLQSFWLSGLKCDLKSYTFHKFPVMLWLLVHRLWIIYWKTLVYRNSLGVLGERSHFCKPVVFNRWSAVPESPASTTPQDASHGHCFSHLENVAAALPVPHRCWSVFWQLCEILGSFSDNSFHCFTLLWSKSGYF